MRATKFEGTFTEYKELIINKLKEKEHGMIDFEYSGANIGTRILEAQDGTVGVLIYINGMEALEADRTDYIEEHFNEELVSYAIKSIKESLKDSTTITMTCKHLPEALREEGTFTSLLEEGRDYTFISVTDSISVLLENYFPPFRAHKEDNTLVMEFDGDSEVIFG